MFFTLEVVCTALREGIQIDRLLFAESCEEQASWQENGSLPVYLTNGDKRPGFGEKRLKYQLVSTFYRYWVVS